jgi:hypothetical protein
MSSDVSVAIAAVVVFGLLITGAVLVVRDTIRQSGQWGINFTIPNCRHCNAAMPVVRAPANFRQMMWGGWTCSECGLEVDKWGEPVPDQAGPAKWSTPMVDPRNQARIERPADTRITKPDEGVKPQEGHVAD